MACQRRQVTHQILQVLSVCHQKLPREGLRLLVEQAEDVTVVGAVSGVKAALDLTSQTCPEVALACLDPTAGAIHDEVQQLILNRPGLPVIVVAADPPVAQMQAWNEALLPLARRTDIVVVPVASDQGCELIEPQRGSARGLRSAVVWWMNWMLRGLQRGAGTPEAINTGLFGHLCDAMCAITAWVCGEATRRAWQQANQQLCDNVVQAVRRDPGRRVLVTVDCRRRHQLEARLKALDEIELVPFRDL